MPASAVRAAPSLPLAWALVCAVGSPAVAADVTEEQFVRFAAERAVRFDTLDWREADLSGLSVLDEALEGKRVVLLGEADHFVAERHDIRLLMIRELARRGFRNVGMEMGVFDARRIDRYVETGDPAHLERVGLYGYDGDQRYDREDAVSGWTDDKHPEFKATNLASGRWFLGQLHAMNQTLPPGTPRLRWFGYDVSMRPGGGYSDAHAILTLHGDDPRVAEVKRRLRRVAGETRLEEIRRLHGLLVHLDDVEEPLAARLGADRVDELRRTVHVLADGLAFVESLQDLEDRDRVDAGLRARERVMARIMDDLLARAGPDEKFVLLGHAIHLSKDSTTLELGRPMWPSIGSHLARTLPGEVYGVWMVFDHGRHGNLRYDDPIRTMRSIDGTIEHLLAGVGPRLFLPFHSGDPREAYLDAPRRVKFMAQAATAVLPKETDALFFVADVTECRRRD